MNTLFEPFTSALGWTPFVFDVSLKTLLILCAAFGLTTLLRRASASVRHHVWTLAFVAVLALPVLAISLPSWQVPVPGWAASDATTPVVSVSTPSVTVAPTSPASSPGGADAALGLSASESAVDAAPAIGATSAAARAGLLIWLAGAVLLLMRLGLGVSTAWLTSRKAQRVDDPEWTGLADELARDLEIRTPVRILKSERVTTPMAWGIFRQVLLLPRESEKWSAERRRAVLLHELAHVKRRDCLTHVVAQAVRAVHWFNPLAWIGARRLRAERERACDDLVIAAGTRRADYAKLLLDVARGRVDRRLSYATVSMARRSELEGRLLAILDPALNRRGIGRAAAVATIGLVAGVLIPLAAFQATRWGGGPAPVADEVSVDTKVDVAPKVHVDVRVRDRQEADADPDEARAVAAMLRALGNERASIREQAAHGLGMIESPLAVDGLSAAARSDADATVRAQAAWALGMIEDESGVPALADAIADESARVRSQAAWALGMIEDESGVPALADAITDEDVQVRSQAAWALGMIESASGVPALLTALRDGSDRVRSQAAWGLGMVESSEAVDGLISILASDDSEEVRSQAAWALGMIEDRSAIDALLDAIEDESERVAEQAMWALAQVMG